MLALTNYDYNKKSNVNHNYSPNQLLLKYPYGPNSTLDENAQEEAKSRARENAVSSARKKAEELAKLSGRKLDKAVKIQEAGDVIFPQPLFAQGEADLKQRASQIQPGQQEVTVNLAVDFALK